MRELKYQVSFATPAFLGNAEQSAQWRTPPFKAQLRQWWRVAFAASHNFHPDVAAAMRRGEGRLFGHAWLEDDRNNKGEKISARRSEVRLRLDHWESGKLPRAKWPASETVNHPEVPARIAADLYLGYGPVTLPRGEKSPTLKANAALQAGEQATFSVAFPHEHSTLIEQALYLMDRFGTVGGRSRNGWGSFRLLPLEDTPALMGKLPLRPWQSALELDWPHTLGSDSKGALIWQTPPFDDWKTVMKQLAVIKIHLRTQKPDFEFMLDLLAGDKATRNGINHGKPQARHWLSYPVTNHSVAAWGGNARLPNSLRFKVQPGPNDPKKLVGVIFHVPCVPPVGFGPDPRVIENVWRQVHAYLDAPAQELTRIAS